MVPVRSWCFVLIGPLLVWLLAGAEIVHAAAGTVDRVTPTPTSTNQDAQYKVVWYTGTGTTDLNAGVDTIVVLFNASTYVPTSISASLVTVNGSVANTVIVTGQYVRVVTPVFVNKNGDSARVVISASAGIRNPGTAGSYTLQAYTSKERTPFATSPAYSITTTTTTITQPAVTPNPSVESQAAAYTIGFSVGAGGYLTTSSTVTLTFPSGTTVPNGSISGVTFNGTSASASGNSSTRVVTIACPSTVSNLGAVTIGFAAGSGLANPGAGTKTLSAYTSSESTPVTSANYTISSANNLSVSAINLSSYIANAVAQYTVDFVVSSTGGLTIGDSIILTFPGSTVVPDAISPNQISISSGGFSDYAAAVTVAGGRIAIECPIVISNSSDVSVVILSGANIQNPANGGNYSLDLETTHDAVVTSNPYAITAATSSVTTAAVELSNTAQSATGVLYTFAFSTGAYGRLIPGSSTIQIIFPSGTGYGTLTDTVNGIVASAPSRSGDTVTVTVPASVSILNNGSIVLKIGGITNPAAVQGFTVSIRTSVEATLNVSNTYYVGGSPITITSVTLGNAGVNQTSAYTINATGVNPLFNNVSDYVRVIFPEGTVLPASMADATVTFTGGQTVAASGISVNQTSRSVDIRVGSNNQGFTSINFLVTAGIVNAAVPSTTFYKAIVWTSKNSQNATSPAYTVSSNATSVTAGTVTATPSVISVVAAYEVLFTTGTFGKLMGGTSAGSDSILIEFDAGATFVPVSIDASTVRVNGVNVTGVRVVSAGFAGSIKLDVPPGMTITGGSQVNVTISADAGMMNGSTNGTYDVHVSTDAESVPSTETGNLTLLAVAGLSVTQVSLSPATVNASASYTIKFTTGSLAGDSIAVGDTIKFDFPNNTSVPASIGTAQITVNGINLTTTAFGVGRQLTLRSPVTIGTLANVTVAINASAGILNPTLVGTSYTLDVSTYRAVGGSGGPSTSPQYATTAATSTVSASNVALSSYTPAATGVTYTINFSTGTFGRLIGGTSTITIAFPSGTAFGTLTDSVNGVFGGTPSRTGQEVTVTVPSNVVITNNGSVTVKILGITNPVAGSYTLTAKTSVETSPVASASYPVTSAGAVTFGSVTVAANTDTVNMAGAYTVVFTTGAAGSLASGSGTITVRFASGTAVPSSITAGTNITVNGNNTVTVTTNSGLREVTIVTPVLIGNSTSVTVVFAAACNIVNPSLSGTHTLEVMTSTQPQPATSPSYTIRAATTTINSLLARGAPRLLYTALDWTWTFKTGLRGALVAGVSTITLNYLTSATVPAVITPTNVRVNGTAASTVSVSGTAVTITVPATVTVGNGASVTVIILAAANIQALSDPIDVSGYTSVETTPFTVNDISLPVELVFFSARQQNRHVELSWETASEIENAYWIVQKAVVTDESEDRAQFEIVGTLRGQGNLSTTTSYSIRDEDVAIGETYRYRLADVSYSGAITYHDPVLVTVAAPAVFALGQNYPNPFNPMTSIEFQLPTPSRVQIVVYNVLGQQVVKLTDLDYGAGFHQIVWNGTSQTGKAVASGTYFYRIVAAALNGNGRLVKSRKMMLIK